MAAPAEAAAADVAAAPEDAPLSKAERKVVLAELWGYTKGLRRRMLVAGCALLASSASNALFPKVLGRVMDSASKKEGGSDEGAKGGRIVMAGGVLALVATGAVASATRTYNLHVVAHRLRTRLRRALFGAAVRRGAGYHDGQASGRLRLLLKEDCDRAAAALTESAPKVMRYTSSVVCGATMMLVRSPVLSLVSLSTAPLVAATAIVMSKMKNRKAATLDEAEKKTQIFAEERLLGVKTLKAFRAEDATLDKYEAMSGSNGELATSAALAQGVFMGSMAASGFGAMLAVLGAGAELMNRGRLSVGEVTQFALYTGLMSAGLGGVQGALSELKLQLAAAGRVFKVIRGAEAEARGRSDWLTPKEAAAGLGFSFNKVSFAYASRKEAPVLSGFDLAVAPGEKVAIVGVSGSGKSTLASLILGLYQPDEGIVAVGDVPVDRIAAEYLESKVAVAEQLPAVFSGTVRDAIIFDSRSPISDAEALAAAEAAGFAEVLKGLPQGLEAPVGEGGALLSGGERQRLALTRTLVRKPKLLVLDEPTAALDSLNEAQVGERVQEACAAATLVVLSHSVRFLRAAGVQRAVVLDDEGTIVEDAPLDDLLQDPTSHLVRIMEAAKQDPTEVQ